MGFPPQQQQQQPMLAIVMEFCRLGNLFKMIEKARAFQEQVRAGAAMDTRRLSRTSTSPYKFYSSWERRLEVAYGCAAGLEFMHHNGVVHRDLTSYNVLLDLGRIPGTWVAKLCDFNLSRVVPPEHLLSKSTGDTNSPAWQSPELLSHQPYGLPTDVFAFGNILWEVITLRIPWRDAPADGAPAHSFTEWQIIQKVTKGERMEIPAPETWDPPLPEAPQLIALVKRCWQQNPAARPDMKEVANELRDLQQLAKERLKEQRVAEVRAGH